MAHLRFEWAMPAAASTTLARLQVVLLLTVLPETSAASRDRVMGRKVRVDEVVRVGPMAHHAGAEEIQVQADQEVQGAGLA